MPDAGAGQDVRPDDPASGAIPSYEQRQTEPLVLIENREAFALIRPGGAEEWIRKHIPDGRWYGPDLVVEDRSTLDAVVAKLSEAGFDVEEVTPGTLELTDVDVLRRLHDG